MWSFNSFPFLGTTLTVTSLIIRNVLQSHFTVLSSHIKSLSEYIQKELPALPPPTDAKKKETHNAFVIYPNAFFPGQHGTIAEQLVGKRLVPEVKDQVYEALGAEDQKDQDLEDRYIQAQGWCQDEIAERNWKAYFTEEELEAGMKFDDKTLAMLREKEVDEGKKKVESEVNTLVGLVRYVTTGVPVELQRPLPKAPVKKM